jgi:ribonuclease BN (tRNA processing enzyme)
MTPIEQEITLEDAKQDEGKILEAQRKAGGPMTPYSDETIETSAKTLQEDLDARLEKVQEELKTRSEQHDAAKVQAEVEAEQPEEEKEPERTPQQILEELGIKEDPKVRTIEDANGNKNEYIQKPLSFVGKIQFLSYVGEVLDKAMSGQNALQLNSLFDVPVRGEVLSAADFADAQTFVQAIGKLLIYAPDFLSKSYCIWLRVPEYERDWAIAAMEESLDDEEGLDIIETFIDQNWETLQGFFSEKLPSLSKRLQARYQSSQSEQSKP